MYAMTAAHPTLPIPSFARVTNVANGEQVVVRINDRGPFLHGRIIDLSYTAASKLGYIRAGSAEVEVELLHQLEQEPVEQVASSTTTDRTSATASPAASLSTAVTSNQAPVVQPGASVAPSVGASVAAPVPVASPRELVDERLVVETSLVIEPIVTTPATPTTALAMAVNPPAPTASKASVPQSAKPAQAYLQLGAFSSRENAEAIRTRLTTQLDWLRQPLEIVGDGRLFRLVTGPFVSRDDSTVAAQRIQQSTGALPFTTMR